MITQGLRLLFGISAIISAIFTCNAQFMPVDNYLIDCGSSTTSTVGQRTFVADVSLSSKLATPQDIMANTSPNSVSSLDSSVLYQTARIFIGPSSYSFPIQQHGRHFIRLYFFAFVYQIYNLSAAKFTVLAQGILLLDNFQLKGKPSSAFKEFSLNITRDTLILSFMPSDNLAFVNAIEVVSVPDDLISDTAQYVNPVGHYLGMSEQVLETIYRINMGGPKVTPDNDTLWRNWVNDQSFISDMNLAKFVTYSGMIKYMSGGATEETAPDIVYGTATELAVSNASSALYNLTWEFDVDGTSSYFIRFHFCDIVSEALNLLYFNVYVGGWSVVHDLDLSVLTLDSLATAYYMDVVLSASNATSTLQISVGPSTLRKVLPDGILNGLEVMKIGNNSSSGFSVKSAGSKKKLYAVSGSAIGAVPVVIIVIIIFVLLRKRKMEKQQSKASRVTSFSTGSRTSRGTALTLGPSGSLGYRFPFVVLQEATNNFNQNLVIGVGGFGKVYKGELRDRTKVAVKRADPRSHQGLNEFRTEIELLSRLRHRHLVSLIGYCDERNEMILVYEYMEKGSLKSHLYGSNRCPLDWKQRLEICIAAAKGLHYLHTGSAKAIIHRDVKSANILLDENLVAKVSDFGLSKAGPELDQTHVSTAVKGSFGYLDPEYFRRQKLTEKSDVYSFGVVLLEVICARPVIDPELPREMVNLAEWGIKWQKRGELGAIIDHRIAGSIKPDSLRKFGETVEKCLADYGVERPSMGDVLWNLEYALHLQEADCGDSEVDSINRIIGIPSQVHNFGSLDSTVTVEAAPSNDHDRDLSDVSTSRVFSQLAKAGGR